MSAAVLSGVDLIDNEAWLAGFDAYENGDGCPWDAFGRLGWIAAREVAEREQKIAEALA